MQCLKYIYFLSTGWLPKLRGGVTWGVYMVQRLRCVVVRVRSIPPGGDELAPPILAAYCILYWWTIDICCDICVYQILEIKRVIIIIIIKLMSTLIQCYCSSAFSANSEKRTNIPKFNTSDKVYLSIYLHVDIIVFRMLFVTISACTSSLLVLRTWRELCGQWMKLIRTIDEFLPLLSVECKCLLHTLMVHTVIPAPPSSSWEYIFTTAW